jgi:hypothetical protein
MVVLEELLPLVALKVDSAVEPERTPTTLAVVPVVVIQVEVLPTTEAHGLVAAAVHSMPALTK